MFIFQTHLWDDATPIEETLRTLDDLVRCGKVRYTGACNLVGLFFLVRIAMQSIFKIYLF
jgi:aryl-alcohol dehydrogenase-like predicted oxidoreductase